MRQSNLPYPEIGVIAATRMMAGAGLGLLLANKLTDGKRKSVGWQLLALGALSTVPLAIDVYRKSHKMPPKSSETEAC